MPSLAVSSSADASPDGRLIVFSDGPSDGGRDIYVIAAEGGSPVILTDHPADDREPRWSLDGRHIVFLSDRHGSRALWGVAVQGGKSDGQPFMILEGMQDSRLSTWARNGLFYGTEAIIFDVYTLEIDPQSLEVRGKPRVLDVTPTGSNLGPIWSPDGKHLAFTDGKHLRNELAERFVVVMPSEGGKARKFSFPTGSHGQGYQWSFQWLPDSSGLGCVIMDNEQRLSLVRLELDTGEWKISPIPATGFSRFWSTIAWSGDGKSFFFIKKEEDGSKPGITVYDLETGQERCLFRLRPDESHRTLQMVKLNASRDYKRLAAGKGGKIVLVDVETGHVERLEFDKEKSLRYPSWSPDGKHLVAVGNSSEIFIISLPDGQLKSLDIKRYMPRGEIRSSPDWSPDGRKIVFSTIQWRDESYLIQNLLPKK
jgi:Tol biopolymer transport system component